MMTAPQQHPPHLGVQVQKEQDAEQEAQEDGQSAMRGMGWSCMRRPSLGTSTAPTRKARERTTGVVIKATTAAANSAAAHRADYREFNRRQHEAVPRLQLIWSGQRATKPTFL